ncbi:conserved hypothetical protein [Hyphomicrobiales bacterium]|jgi:hypothetical protein|nr:conserved hypothetical protein [Hyphomicrobiales bacterium]CAH1702665.1 hypothetical protein BOSEA1005_30537 [Hyphomicrobiales bacterium]CAI0346855.1 conserved hypothetical protein [Hyphomicrobiales bacterium]
MSAAEIQIKSLPWQLEVENGQETRFADSVIGRFVAWEERGKAYAILPALPRAEMQNRRHVGAAIEDALAFCQQHFDAAIRSALA